jgi:hypothetical protein
MKNLSDLKIIFMGTPDFGADILSALIENKFNIICFDYSVFKFIRQDGKTIKYLYKLLSDNGVLILVDPSSNNGGIIPLFKDISGNIISPKEEKYQLLKMDFYYKRLDITNKWFKDVNFKEQMETLDLLHKQTLELAEKFNGNLVMELTGLKERELGLFITEFRNKFICSRTDGFQITKIKKIRQVPN